MGLLKGRGLSVFVCCIVFLYCSLLCLFFCLLGCCFVLGIAYLFAVWLLWFLFLLLSVLFFLYVLCWVLGYEVWCGSWCVLGCGREKR